MGDIINTVLRGALVVGTLHFVVTATITPSVAQTVDTWATKTPMPTARTFPTSGAVGGKIYVIGGQDASAVIVGTVEEYDSSTDMWATKASMPATPASGPRASV